MPVLQTVRAALSRRPRHRPALALLLLGQLAVLGLVGWAFGSVVGAGLDGSNRVDGSVTRYVVSHRVAQLTTGMRLVSHLGSVAVLIPVVLAVGLSAKLRGRGWRPLAVLGAAQLGSILLYDCLKPLVGRPRPAVGQLVATAGGFAFPSGHATQTTAVVGALAYLGAAALPTTGAKAAIWAGAAALVLLVGFSRVYLGVHWTSDVLAGFALGALWLAALLTTANKVGDGH